MGKEMMTGSDEAAAGASSFLFPAGSAAGLAAAALSFSTAVLAAKTEADSFAGGAGGGSGLILDRADRKAFGQKGKKMAAISLLCLTGGLAQKGRDWMYNVVSLPG